MPLNTGAPRISPVSEPHTISLMPSVVPAAFFYSFLLDFLRRGLSNTLGVDSLPVMVLHPVYLGIGSNLGDRAGHLQHALDRLSELTQLVAVSSVRETEPVGPIEQGQYLNAAAAIETKLPPRQLLEALHTIERASGRDRTHEKRWGPRTLDLDILVYADRVIDEPGLTIPHPCLHERRFVLEPLAEIAAELIVPGLHQTVSGLLTALERAESGASL